MATKKSKVSDTVAESHDVPAENAQEAEQAAAEAARIAEETAAKIAELKGQEDELEVQLREVKAKLRELSPSAASRRGPVGVGVFIKEKIAEGKTNAEIMDLVTEQFPANNTNTNCINWYRNALKNWPDGKRPGKKAATSVVTDDQDPSPLVDSGDVSDEADEAQSEAA